MSNYPINNLLSLLSPYSGRTIAGITIIAIQIFTGASLLGYTRPAEAGSNPYRKCADVLSKQGIAAPSAATACALALKPEKLSRCVSDINRRNKSGLNPNAILNSCQQVRRPDELSTCVVDIGKKIQDVDAGLILKSCQNSLLPKVYAECVLGLNSRVGLSGNDLLGTCLDPKNYTSNVTIPNPNTSEPMTPSDTTPSDITPSDMTPPMEPIPPSRGNRTRNRQ